MVVECPHCRTRVDAGAQPAGSNLRCRCGAEIPLPVTRPVAGALSCPQCGATAAPGSSRCAFCQAPLTAVACPHCLGRVFPNAVHCPHCGHKLEVHAAVQPPASPGARLCPRCPEAVPLTARVFDTIAFDECPRCGGTWLSTAALQQVLQSREQEAAVWIRRSSEPRNHPAAARAPRDCAHCPTCGQLMQRRLFAQASGLVVNSCKGHGTWFERDQLGAAVKFVLDGGMAEAKRRDIEQRLELALHPDQGPPRPMFPTEDRRIGRTHPARLWKWLLFLAVVVLGVKLPGRFSGYSPQGPNGGLTTLLAVLGVGVVLVIGAVRFFRCDGCGQFFWPGFGSDRPLSSSRCAKCQL